MSHRPVSEVLEADLRTFVRRNGLALWLDPAGHYSAFVDALAARPAGELPYTVRAFRGSHLALLLALDGLAAGADKTYVMLHLPGFTEKSVRQTPLLELYEAGSRYQKGLETLVEEAAAGRVSPERISAFKEASGLSLAGADAWLSALLQDPEGGFGARLREMSPDALVDQLLEGGTVAANAVTPEGEAALWARVSVALGLPASWREALSPPAPRRAEDLAFVIVSWALCVEYVDDLKRPPVSPLLAGVASLPAALIKACAQLASRLRARQGVFYQRTADETELRLADEVAAAAAEDLGKIDTFRFEEDKVLKAALDALEREDWAKAAAWASARAGQAEQSFWLRLDHGRSAAWELVGAAARLGLCIGRAGALGLRAGAGGLEGAIKAYVERGAAVDEAHRLLEQRRLLALTPQVPEFEALRARLGAMRPLWKAWADGWARDFNALCKAEGFLPPPAYQQRNLFEDVVRPMTQQEGVTTAYFLVDALRFEMALTLSRHIEGTPSTDVQLKARLAELPSVTEVGMNALAPVAKGGRLRPALSSDGSEVVGLSTGEFRVFDPETRRRAMHDRVGGATCPLMRVEEVVERDSVSLKRAIARAKLVVVHSDKIDRAGDKGHGLEVFERELQQLRAAWQLLRDAGVRRFVFTADHGFLLVDDDPEKAQPHGRRVDAKRRHVLTEVEADREGEVRVPLSQLGYEGLSGSVIFPETTAVFLAQRQPTGFVHGGNSLEERVIPVLTVVHRAAAGGSALAYGVEAEAREDVGDMHCLEATVVLREQGSLDFGSAKELELSLRALDGEAVKAELCSVRGAGRLEGGAILAQVGARFELFFRLLGASNEKVRVELYHPSAAAQLTPSTLETRFAVAASGARRSEAPAVTVRGDAWLEQLPEGGVRQVFAHIAAHGTVTEPELARIIGGRQARTFARELELHVQKAPFDVQVEVVAGIKRYVRKGSR